MRPERANRILSVLGWSRAEFLRRLNRAAGTKHGKGDGWRWFSGERGFPDGAAVFLKLSLRIAQLERQRRRLLDRLATLQEQSPASRANEKPIRPARRESGRAT